ncbi:MAG: tyrosine-protein phosphatase [Oligoflexia bacterium]|nr:tyrosine-protein phosphatase [Oligoflexia bacterium]
MLDVGVHNFGIVTEGVYRGGILSYQEDYQQLAQIGVKSIISLEYFHEENQDHCKEFALACKQFPIFLLPGGSVTTSKNLQMLKDAFHLLISNYKKGVPTYVHCYKGGDRTGALVSLFMIHSKACRDGGPSEQYNPSEIENEITQTLDRFQFDHFLFPQVHKEIMDWVQNPPSWLCD